MRATLCHETRPSRNHPFSPAYIDVLACPRCGGRLRLIATVEDPSAIHAILTPAGEKSDTVEEIELAESHLTPSLFRQILQRIKRLAWHPT